MILLLPLSWFCYSKWNYNTNIYISGMFLTPENIPTMVFCFVASCFAPAAAFLVIYRIYAVFPRQIVINAGPKSMYLYILQTYVFFGVSRMSGFDISPGYKLLLSAIAAPFMAVMIVYILLRFSSFIEKRPLLALCYFGRLKKREWTPSNKQGAKSPRCGKPALGKACGGLGVHFVVMSCFPPPAVNSNCYLLSIIAHSLL